MRNIKKSGIVFVLLIVVMMFGITGCGKESKAEKEAKSAQKVLSGKWIDTNNETTIELFSDNTGIMSYTDGSKSFSISSWLYENDRIKFTCSSIVGDINISGKCEIIDDDTWIYTDEDNENDFTKYVREKQ